MTDNTDAVVPAVAPELKSTDTRTHVNDQPTKNELAKPSPEVKAEPAKPEAGTQDVALEGAGTDALDADSTKADSRKVKERIERVRRKTAQETRETVLRELVEKGLKLPDTQAQPPAQTAPEVTDQEPTLADCDFDSTEYTKRMYAYLRGQERKQEAAQATEREQAKLTETFKSRIDALEEKVGAGAWEDIESSHLNKDPSLKPLVDSVLGGVDIRMADAATLELLHHLAGDAEESKRLASLSPSQRVREIAKLADRFDEPAQVANIPTVLPKKTTNAPPPPKTVSGAGKGAIDVNSPNISSEDRIKAWRAGRK